MLAQLLALLVGFSGFILYMAAFFFPEVHRKNDFLWSGVVLFYALVLWVYAGRITGGVLLGQVASVVLLGWLGGQTLAMRRQLTPYDQQTWVSDAGKSVGDVLFLQAAQLGQQLQERWDRLPWPAPLRQLPARLGNRTSAPKAVSTAETPTTETPTAETPTGETSTGKTPTGESNPISAEAPPVDPLATETPSKATAATVKPKQVRQKAKVDARDRTTESPESVVSPEPAQSKTRSRTQSQTDIDQKIDQRTEPVGAEVPQRRKRPKSATVSPGMPPEVSVKAPVSKQSEEVTEDLSASTETPIEVPATATGEAPLSYQSEPAIASDSVGEPPDAVSSGSQSEAATLPQDSSLSPAAQETESELPTESTANSITEPIEPIEDVVPPPIPGSPETIATDPVSLSEMAPSEEFESEELESEEFESEQFESGECEAEESRTEAVGADDWGDSVESEASLGEADERLEDEEKSLADQPGLNGSAEVAVEPSSLAEAEPENFWEGSEIAPETLRPSDPLSIRPWEDRPPLPNLLAARYRPADTTDAEWENTGLEDPLDDIGLDNIWDDDSSWEEGWGDTTNEQSGAAVDPLEALHPKPVNAAADTADSEGWDMNWDSPPDTPTTIDPPPIQPIVEPILEPMDLPSLDEMFATGNRYRVSDEIVDVTAVEIEDRPRRRRPPALEAAGDRPSRRPAANTADPSPRRRPKPMLEEPPAEEKEMNNDSFFDDDDDWV